MKSKIVFKYQNEVIGFIDNKLTLEELENIKQLIADSKGIEDDEIELSYEDIHDSMLLSLLSIDKTGKLIYTDLSQFEIRGIRISVDIHDTEILHKFLDKIMNNTINEYIEFII